MVLETPAGRAIPEDFIRPIISAGIEPILMLNLPLSSPPHIKEIDILLQAYAHWGVHYISLFDRPNTLKAWREDIWVQQKLVERFLNTFIPLAKQVVEVGMFPLFPALEPGGNFWDTAFLKSALQSMAPKHAGLLEHLVIGAYAWSSNQSLNWGAGGPENWPGARPYETPKDQQDHRGFRIFDWYNAISQKTLGTELPIILLGTGSRLGDLCNLESQTVDNKHAEINVQIAKLLAGETTAFVTPETPHPVPENVLAGCFTDILYSDPNQSGPQTWYLPDGEVLPVVQKLKIWHSSRQLTQPHDIPLEVTNSNQSVESNSNHNQTKDLKLDQFDIPVRVTKPIKHYLLLPQYEWGVATWYLEASQPYIQKYSPTIGFSIKEAFLAEKVTVVGGIHTYPEQLITELEKSGSTVVQISGNGTDIATLLTIK
ncbi:MAG: hypothetical protein GWN14_08715 [candidate division Zixibacteria bacterium]|nr:hypothetical protein [candidate division Zixibacteria bacterium]